MSDELAPPGTAVAHQETIEPGARQTLTMLRLTRSRWDTIPPAPPIKAAAVVAGSWLLMAWGRFGFQGLGAPRALARFVLVGVYSWLAMAAIVWLLAVAQRSRSATQADPVRILQVIGLSHQPLVVFGVMLQIGQAVPIPGLMTIVAIVLLGFWFPGMLLAGVSSIVDRLASPPIFGAAAAAAAYLLWLATAGRYLLDKLGHLI